MSKRKIFDIEKVGFGDEVVEKKQKPTVQVVEEKSPLTPTNLKTSNTEMSTEKQIKPEDEKVKRKNQTSDVLTVQKSKLKPKKIATNFRPNVFVSPIYGIMEDRSVLSKLAKGNYKLSTMNSQTVNPVVKDTVEKQELNNQVNASVWIKVEEVNVEEQRVREEVIVEIVEELDDFIKEDSQAENEALSEKETDNWDEPNETSLVELNISDEVMKLDDMACVNAFRSTQEIEESHECHPLFLEEVDGDFCDEVVQAEIVMPIESCTFYEMPPVTLLNDPMGEEINDEDWILEKMNCLEQTFLDFGVKVRLTGDWTQGPTVTQIEIQPESGTKISKILGLQNDLKLNLAVEELRIEAPIPGKNTIGIEIPNRMRKTVMLKEIVSNRTFMTHESPLLFAVGLDICGEPVYTDIMKMPHGLIAGQTGSGKSVCINTLLISILFKASPEDVRIMLIDPKRVELAPYNKIPHLVTPVITDEKKAESGLRWAVEEMERRYELFAENGVRDIKMFNDRRLEFEMDYEKLPYILIIIDELADLMMVSPQEVEDHIMRITQKARAAGIHLIVATQRPTVDVITGTIKSNIPTRIAFAVAQGNDSKVILDEVGAQNLLGQGDMLISENGTSKAKRVQGAFISAKEIDDIVDYVKKQASPKYLIADSVFTKMNQSVMTDLDPLLNDVIEFIIEQGHASTSSIQRRFRTGYNRAARMIDTLEAKGFIGKQIVNSSKPREVLITSGEFEAYLEDETRY